MKEKPRIIVNCDFDPSSPDYGVIGANCLYMELYSDGYAYYLANGKQRFPFRAFGKNESRWWTLAGIEERISEGHFIEYTGEKAQAFLAEQVLRR